MHNAVLEYYCEFVVYEAELEPSMGEATEVLILLVPSCIQVFSYMTRNKLVMIYQWKLSDRKIISIISFSCGSFQNCI